jgi:alcohol dehydrogenase (cytochrome c)
MGQAGFARACVAVSTLALFGTGSASSSAEVGPFTREQAVQGRRLYEKTCAACHGAELTGGAAPPLSGSRFEGSWSHPQVTLDDLLFLQTTTMPPRAASTLSADDHAAVFAYVLERNGYGAGTTAARAGTSALKKAPRWSAAAAAKAAAAAPQEFVPAEEGAVPGTSGPDQAALDAAEDSGEWLVYTHDYRGTRHSPLKQVDATNAGRLVPACVFQVGETDNFQTGPLVHAGTMYFTTWRTTFAIDAATCRPRWRSTWKLRGASMWQRNRGLALKDGRVVRGTADGYLIALSAETGKLLWARRVADTAAGETFTMAPLVYDDLVLIGPAGSENNVQGWVGAFRLADGSPVWRFNLVPRPGEPGYETWENPKGIPMGGGSVWTFFSLDRATGELHVAATNPAPDLPSHLRKGENLYTNSIVCLDVRTGKRKWHRSLVPNDTHDYDLTHASPLFDAAVGGATRRLVGTAGKDGFLRVLDRETHDVVYATAVTTIEHRDVPVTTTPTRACPGPLGGVEWSGPAYNPATGLLYVPAVDWCATFTAHELTRYIPGKLYLGGDADMDPPAKAQGWLTAVDAATGQVRWKYRSPRPMVASAITTAGGLLLTGELTGDFLALDARDGRELYRFNTGGPMGGGIVTYEVGGKQHIAAASGSPSAFWTDANPGAPTIVVFKLP